MNEYLRDELEELEILEKEVFVIKDLAGLTWAFKKLAAIHAEMKEVNDIANAERLKIDSWEKKKTEPLKQSVSFFEHKIKEYHEQQLALDPKNKSISTPYGKAKSTTVKAQPAIGDKESLLKYLKENDNAFIEVKEDVKWSELKKGLVVVENELGSYVIDENGQIIEGVEVKPMNTTFKIEVGN